MKAQTQRPAAAKPKPSTRGRPKNHPKIGTAMHMAAAPIRPAASDAPIAVRLTSRDAKTPAAPACRNADCLTHEGTVGSCVTATADATGEPNDGMSAPAV